MGKRKNKVTDITYTLENTDGYFVYEGTSNATLFLPDANTCEVYDEITIINNSDKTVDVFPFAGQTIGGKSKAELSGAGAPKQGDAVVLTVIGGNWLVASTFGSVNLS